MRVIAELVDKIDDEILDAKNYAESYLEKKAKKDEKNSSVFRTMAEQELQHAINLHDLAVSEINELSEVYTPPTAMQEEWDKAHARYVEKVAWVKQMLAM